MRRFVAPIAIVVLLGWLLPGAASACAVCLGTEQRSRTAFVITTALLSSLPLAMIGALGWLVWRRERANQAAARGSQSLSPSGQARSRSIG